MADEFCLKMPDFHVTFRDLLHAVNIRHGTDGFTSPPKEGVLGIFSPWKIQRLRPGLNPRTWVPKASTLPLDHRSRLGTLFTRGSVGKYEYITSILRLVIRNDVYEEKLNSDLLFHIVTLKFQAHFTKCCQWLCAFSIELWALRKEALWDRGPKRCH